MNENVEIYFKYENDGAYLEYQNFYLLGMSKFLLNKELWSNIHRVGFTPYLLNKFINLRNDQIIFKKLNVQSKKGNIDNQFCSKHDSHVGQYLFNYNGKMIKVAIDSHDKKDIRSEEILGWSDIYFKSNMWQSINYHYKVKPIVNGNGTIDYRKIRYLKRLQKNKRKKYDMVFISRIWGGIEHNIRIFEELSKINSNKVLIAIFPKGCKKNSKTIELINRLKFANVEYTFNTFPQNKIWQYHSNSKLNITRAGKHLCISWGMIDLLCLGSCILIDNDPYPNWPKSLKNKINFISLGINGNVDNDSGKDYEYSKIPEIVNKILNDPALQKSIRSNNINYFLKHCEPEMVAKYIIKTIYS